MMNLRKIGWMVDGLEVEREMGQWENTNRCPRCDSDRTQHIGKEKTDFFTIDKRLCHECGLIFQELTYEEVNEFLDAMDEFYSEALKE